MVFLKLLDCNTRSFSPKEAEALVIGLNGRKSIPNSSSVGTICFSRSRLYNEYSTLKEVNTIVIQIQSPRILILFIYMQLYIWRTHDTDELAKWFNT